VTLKKYLVLCAVMVLASSGNVALAKGMRGVTITRQNWTHLLCKPVPASSRQMCVAITWQNWPHLLALLFDPWVIAGILLLMGFMAAYMTALSWADLTYVLPATAAGYVVTALLGRFFLGEDVTTKRWIGITLVTVGVGFVAGGPSRTAASFTHPPITGELQAESDHHD
jgi:multidrug transporter EmrE-like cation transporter